MRTQSREKERESSPSQYALWKYRIQQEVLGRIIANSPFTTYGVFDTTPTAYKTTRPTVFVLLRVYSLPWERVYRAQDRPSLLTPYPGFQALRRGTQTQTARWFHKPSFIFGLFSLFWKEKSRLMRSPCYLWIPLYQLSNAWTNLYKTLYVYHGAWAHLNGVLQKSLPSVCVSVRVSLVVARQRLGKTLLRQRIHTQQQNCWTRRFQCGPCRIKGKQAISCSQNFLFQNKESTLKM
jgi:hypothetical protein